MQQRNEVNWANPKRPYLEVNGISEYGMGFFRGKKPSKVQLEDDTIRVWFTDEPLTEQETRYERERKEVEAKALMDKRLVERVSDTTRGRRDNYGRPLVNFLRIASLWHDYLAGQGKLAPLQFISPEDVAFLMILLKVARAEHSYQDDNLLDIFGYTDCLDDMNRQMKELGYAEGLGALKTMSITEMGLLGGRLTHKV